MIRIGNISFSYTGEAPYLLHNLSLDVKPGDYISIVGSNGSGRKNSGNGFFQRHERVD